MLLYVNILVFVMISLFYLWKMLGFLLMVVLMLHLGKLGMVYLLVAVFNQILLCISPYKESPRLFASRSIENRL